MAANSEGPAHRPAVALTSDPSWPEGSLQNLRVNPITGALKTEVSGAGSGGTSAVDQASFTAGASAGTPAMGEGGGQLLIVSLNATTRAQLEQIVNSSGTEIFTLANPGRVQGVGTFTVDGSGVTQPVSGNITQTPAASGGTTIYRLLSAASTNGNNIKGSAGQLYGFIITNTNAAARFVKLYNKATTPTVGTDTPVITLVIPGNASGAGMVASEFVSGIAFGTGIGIGITGAVADNDTTAVAANEVVVNLFYK